MQEDAPQLKTRRARAARLTAEQRRSYILATAVKLISHSGFNAISQADIATACGVGKSLINHYFPSMKALLAAVLEAKEQIDFLDLSGGTYPPSQPAQVRAFLTRHIERNLTQWEIIRLHRMLDAEAMDPAHPAHAYFSNRYIKTRTMARELLTFKRNPILATQELLSFWHGLELEWVRDRDLPVLSIWNAFADRFFCSDP